VTGVTDGSGDGGKCRRWVVKVVGWLWRWNGEDRSDVVQKVKWRKERDESVKRRRSSNFEDCSLAFSRGGGVEVLIRCSKALSQLLGEFSRAQMRLLSFSTIAIFSS
jgi:hypothetical protein